LVIVNLVASESNRSMAARNSVIESLRIFAMFAIVLSHYCLHGGMFSDQSNSVSSLVLAAGASWGKWGVDLFVLITGFFLSAATCKEKLIKHILKYCVQVWTTSILCVVCFALYSRSHIGLKVLISALFPIGYNMWWFATAYFVLLILSPFLNVLLSSLSKQQHKNMIIAMLLLWSVPVLLLPKSSYDYAENTSLFLMLYAIGGYIRKYNTIEQKRPWIFYSIGLMGLMAISSVLIRTLCVYFPFLKNDTLYFVTANSPLTIMAAITTLLAALAIKPISSNLVDRIAASAFGVYLFTDSVFTRPIIWYDLVHTKEQFYSANIVFLMISSVLCVFLAAAILEIARQIFIQKPVMRLCEVIFGKLRNLSVRSKFDTQ